MNETKATVPISGRVAEEDYLFLMERPIAGKVTASEKLRYVMSFFRVYHESLIQFDESLTEMNRLLEMSRKDIKRAEMESEVSSDLMDKLMQILPEMMAYLITARMPKKGTKQLPSLLELEERLFKNVVGLIEAVLRMGLTSQSPTYNPNLLNDRLAMTRELVELAQQNKSSKS